MPIVPRDLEPPLILSIALIASCLSMPESPAPGPEINATAQAATVDIVLSEQDQDDEDIREANALDALLEYQSHDTDLTLGGHCNVRLVECDPYPVGKSNHPRADAICSRVCLDTIAHCEDYSTAEIEYCCAHPDQNYRDSSGKQYPQKHCMPSGEPNWHTRCAPGLNP